MAMVAWLHAYVRCCPFSGSARTVSIFNEHCRRSSQPQPRGSGGDATPRKEGHKGGPAVMLDAGASGRRVSFNAQKERLPRGEEAGTLWLNKGA